MDYLTTLLDDLVINILCYTGKYHESDKDKDGGMRKCSELRDAVNLYCTSKAFSWLKDLYYTACDMEYCTYNTVSLFGKKNGLCMEIVYDDRERSGGEENLFDDQQVLFYVSYKRDGMYSNIHIMNVWVAAHTSWCVKVNGVLYEDLEGDEHKECASNTYEQLLVNDPEFMTWSESMTREMWKNQRLASFDIEQEVRKEISDYSSKYKLTSYDLSVRKSEEGTDDNGLTELAIRNEVSNRWGTGDQFRDYRDRVMLVRKAVPNYNITIVPPEGWERL